MLRRDQMLRLIGLLGLILSIVSATACRSYHLTETGQIGAVGTVGGAVLGTTEGAIGGPVGAIMGGVVGTTVGHFMQKHMTDLQRLKHRGIEFVAYGDNLVLILPSKKLFYPHSPKRLLERDFILDLIANMLRKTPKITVKIAAYTAPTCSKQRDLALTRQQAHNIANYLWREGIDARIAYAVGYGAAHPISRNTTAAGRTRNERVEISLRVIHPE